MSIFSSLRVGASALRAQRLRMDVVSSNIANMESTRTPEGGPYRRKQVVFAPNNDGLSFGQLVDFLRSGARAEPGNLPQAGVDVVRIVEDDAPPKLVFNPGHPDANPEGLVEYPNVDLITEMTDLMAASRSYEATVTALAAAKAMATKALELGR